MSKYVLKNPKIYIDGMSLSAKLNNISFPIEVDMKEQTNFNSSGAEEYLPGLVNWKLDYSGYWSAGDNDVDSESFNQIGSTDYTYITVAPETGTTGDLVYYGQAKTASFNFLGEVGEIAPFEISVQGDGTPSNGTIIFTQSINSSGYGEVYDLSAVESGQSIRSILHVTNFSGTGNLIAILQANSSSGYSGGNPGTDIISFTTFSDEGAEIKIGTPTTDQHFYRLEYASSGAAAPNIDLTAAMAVEYGQS